MQSGSLAWNYLKLSKKVFAEKLSQLLAILQHVIRYLPAYFSVEFEQLIFVESREYGMPAIELSNDTPQAPHVYLKVISLQAEHDLGRSVKPTLHVGIELVADKAR
jgi:hypothetical protein